MAWGPSFTGGAFESDNVEDVITAVPGIGMMSAFHPLFANAKWNEVSTIRRDPDTTNYSSIKYERIQGPGAGAFSSYHNVQTVTTEKIYAGQEIFLNFGESFVGHDDEINRITSRSVEWLMENGRCMDNIVVGKSKIVDAGRGAYATRSFQKGDVITSTPLIHIMNKAVLEMQSLEKLDESTKNVGNGNQLLLNYCFGNTDSSLLLFPINSGVNLINHSSKKANVEISWAHGFDLFQKKFLRKDIKALEDVMEPVLFFDIKAIGEIKEGDELYLDYGNEWEEAWNDHMKTYTEDPDLLHNKKYVSAVYMNHRSSIEKEGSYFLTEKEQAVSPYPENILTACYISSLSMTKDKVSEIQEGSFRANNTGNASHFFMWEEFEDTFDSESLKQCKIVRRNRKDIDKKNTSVLYDYDILILEGRILVEDVPQSALLFVDKPHTSEQHWEGAFRQPIQIPEVFPEKWKNLKYSDYTTKQGKSCVRIEGTKEYFCEDSIVTNFKLPWEP